MTSEIQLINSIPELEEEYRRTIQKFIDSGILTLEEWNTKYKFYRDKYGYSMISLLECVFFNIDLFITENLLILQDRKDLEKRFGIRIKNAQEILNGKQKKEM
jgi:hypothetical protein